MELSHCAVSSEVFGHSLALTTNTPKTQAGCPWAGGGATGPRIPPPGPKDPSHRDAKRPASPALPCGPAHLLAKVCNKASHFSPPHHGGRRFGVRPTDPSVAQQRGSAHPAPGCTSQGGFQPGKLTVLHLPIGDFVSYLPNSSALSQVRSAHLKDSYSKEGWAPAYFLVSVA